MIEIGNDPLPQEQVIVVQPSQVARLHNPTSALCHNIVAVMEELCGHSVDGLANPSP